MVWKTIILAIISAATYAASQYLKRKPTDKPEDFDWSKFISTVVLGGIIGFVAALKGLVPDQASVETQLALFAGATVIIENALKIIWRSIKKYMPIDPIGEFIKDDGY